MRRRAGCGGGGIESISISLGNCGRSRRVSLWKNDCITLTHGQNKVVLYYNTDTQNLEVRYFDNFKNTVYSNNHKKEFILDEFTIDVFKSILGSLVFRGEIDDINACFIIKKIIGTYNSNTLPIHCSKIVECLSKIVECLNPLYSNK